jgi:hypothetical protein
MNVAAHLSVALFLLQVPIGSIPAQQVALSAPKQQLDLVRRSSLLAVRAALDVENVALGDALVKLRISSGVPVAFSPSIVPADRLVTCRCSEIRRSTG